MSCRIVVWVEAMEALRRAWYVEFPGIWLLPTLSPLQSPKESAESRLETVVGAAEAIWICFQRTLEVEVLRFGLLDLLWTLGTCLRVLTGTELLVLDVAT